MRQGATGKMDEIGKRPEAEESQWRSLDTIFLAIMGVLLVATVPAWAHSVGWGYYPSIGIGLVLFVWGILTIPVNGARY